MVLFLFLKKKKNKIKKKHKQFANSTSRRTDFWFHEEFVQTLPGKAFPLWDKGCELRWFCLIAGAWSTHPLCSHNSVVSPPQAQPCPEPPPGGCQTPREAGIALGTHHGAGMQGHRATHRTSHGHLTWTWSSRRRCWKSRGSAVRVAGPTSANTPALPPQPPQTPTPASSGAPKHQPS